MYHHRLIYSLIILYFSKGMGLVSLQKISDDRDRLESGLSITFLK